MTVFVCGHCRKTVDGDPIERRLELRNSRDHSRLRTVKIGDVCKACAHNEADQLTARRRHEVIGSLAGDDGYLLYDQNGVLGIVRVGHDTARAVRNLLEAFGPAELVSVRRTA